MSGKKKSSGYPTPEQDPVMDMPSGGFPDNPSPDADPIMGIPQDSYDMVNKYGTYNIQPTADTENAFPTIAQGLPRGKKTQHRK